MEYIKDNVYRSVKIPFDGNGGAGHSLRSDMNWDNMSRCKYKCYYYVNAKGGSGSYTYQYK